MLIGRAAACRARPARQNKKGLQVRIPPRLQAAEPRREHRWGFLLPTYPKALRTISLSTPSALHSRDVAGAPGSVKLVSQRRCSTMILLGLTPIVGSPYKSAPIGAGKRGFSNPGAGGARQDPSPPFDRHCRYRTAGAGGAAKPSWRGK